MTVREILTELRRSLTPVVGTGEARAMSEIIVEDTTGLTRTAIAVNPDYEITPESLQRIRDVERRVMGGEPVQYALGVAQFRGRMFKVLPGVLIPRPETATLVDMIVDEAHGLRDLRVLDVGSGSGCIACSLARDLAFAQVVAMDISAVAVAVTEENARALGVRIKVVQEDILNYQTSLPGTGDYDIVVSNPPYVMQKEKAEMERRVLDHEPHEALFVPDADPLIFYRTIAKKAWTRLAHGGRLYFEINPLCAQSMQNLMEDIGYEKVTLRRDSFGKVRFLTCQYP